jgi:hypothetical protein
MISGLVLGFDIGRHALPKEQVKLGAGLLSAESDFNRPIMSTHHWFLASKSVVTPFTVLPAAGSGGPGDQRGSTCGWL